MANNNMTAVEWLVRKLSTELIGEIPLHRWDEIREVVQNAKQMENKQIEKAYEQGALDGYEPNYGSGKQYYNETYGTANSSTTIN